MVNIVLVDTPALLLTCLQSLDGVSRLAVDLEGVDLCRSGRVCLLQLFAEGSSTVFVVDVTILGAAAFQPVPGGKDSLSLQAILEDGDVEKLLFDCRNDCDALYWHFGISCKGVFDVQLLELVKRCGSKRFLHGLGKTIDEHIPAFSRARFSQVKSDGLRLFVPERGGSYEVFEARPLNPVLLRYAAQDVEFLFLLVRRLRGTDKENARILRESARRVEEAKGRFYKPHGRDKALAPVSW